MNKRKLFALLGLLLLGYAPASVTAQSDEEAVMVVISQLFDGMRAADSSMVREVFHPTARLQTVMVREGSPILNQGDIEEFITAVGTPHEGIWDERLFSTTIQIDGHLATAWTEYSFYHGGKFSHCGVNAFQLFKHVDGWKIIQITDTRRKTGCQME